MDFVHIPAGEFLMGSDPKVDKQAYSDEQPQHKVTLPDYWMAKTPVTNAHYAAFLAATQHRTPGHWKNGKPPQGKENHPVVYVSWDDAAAFCQWLSQKSGHKISLPTEAQWEKAARGTDARIYTWENNQYNPEFCNGRESRIGTTSIVGIFPQSRSPYQVEDMLGNVWEWTRTEHASKYTNDYTGDDTNNCPQDKKGADISVRGGSYSSGPQELRCSARYYFRNTDTTDLDDVGFRVVITTSKFKNLG
ncbi:MAG: formylglycine-generating enzyme family protein [Anaerolineales bacterium]